MNEKKSCPVLLVLSNDSTCDKSFLLQSLTKLKDVVDKLDSSSEFSISMQPNGKICICEFKNLL